MGRSTRIAVHPRADLHWDASHEWWVAPDLDDKAIVWTWPPYTAGWAQRVPYTGEYAFDALPWKEAHKAFNTDWPGARPLPKEAKPPSKARDPRLTLSAIARVCLTADELQAIATHCAMQGISISVWGRALLVAALEREAPRAAPESSIDVDP